MPVEADAEEYNMNHKRRGKAVIFNHEDFRKKSLRRFGTAKDVKFLQETYKNLGFEVVVHKNMTAEKIKETITNCKFKQGVLN